MKKLLVDKSQMILVTIVVLMCLVCMYFWFTLVLKPDLSNRNYNIGIEALAIADAYLNLEMDYEEAEDLIDGLYRRWDYEDEGSDVTSVKHDVIFLGKSIGEENDREASAYRNKLAVLLGEKEIEF